MNPAVCYGFPDNAIMYGTIGADAQVREIPDHGVCDGKRKCYRVFCPRVGVDDRPTYVAQSCLCNEVRGVVNRVLKSAPRPAGGSSSSLKLASRIITGRLRKLGGGGLVAWEWGKVYENYSGSRKARYASAHDSLLELGPAVRRDSQISAFIKGEKCWGEPKDPRVIQARDARYNIELASFLKPVEKLLYALTSSVKLQRVTDKLPWIVKGLNAEERARVLYRRFEQFEDPVCMSLDASRFDLHVSEEVLEIEHSIYLRLFNNDPRLKQLLSWQIVNKGRTLHGMKYKCRGRRMSGDVNTALGNCLVVCTLVLAAMLELKPRRWDIHDDGDDCLLIVERCDYERVRSCILGTCEHPHHHPRDGIPIRDAHCEDCNRYSLTCARCHAVAVRQCPPGVFGTYGFKMKIENVTDEYHRVVHCQTRPTYSDSSGQVRYRMVRDYRKVLKTALTATRHYDQPKNGLKVLRAIGLCELALCSGLPVFQSFASMLLRITHGSGLPRIFPDAGYAARVRRELGLGADYASDAMIEELLSVKTEDITDRTRTWFSMTWDLSVEDQLHWERYFDTLGASDFQLPCTPGEDNFLPGEIGGPYPLDWPRTLDAPCDYPDLEGDVVVYDKTAWKN